MRRRRSAIASSRKLIEKERIESVLASIFESPWFEGWPSASLAEVTSAGSRLTAPTAAEAERRIRRVGNVAGMTFSSLAIFFRLIAQWSKRGSFVQRGEEAEPGTV